MALRDRVSRPVAVAVPAIPAILSESRPLEQPIIAKIARIASPVLLAGADAFAGIPTAAEWRAARHWRFLVIYPDGESFEARTLPEATEAEAAKLWPGADVAAISQPQTLDAVAVGA